MTNERKQELDALCLRFRNELIDILHDIQTGHPGGSLSCLEIITTLYTVKMKHDPKNPKMEGRDRLILSKGHAAPALYATLASVGMLDKQLLNTLRKYDSTLEGHPSNKIPGIDVSSGSLGQGLSVANGMALAKKIDNKPGYVYAILGDGELEEGQVWEALMTTNKYNLNNLIMFVDYNGLQIDGFVNDVKKLTNVDEKIASFGLNIIKCDGNNTDEILKAIHEAKESNKPTCIIAKTIKGKGVSFMENEAGWHGKAPNEEEYLRAKAELEANL
jgi:transketolase